jgi:hypothetical protein
VPLWLAFFAIRSSEIGVRGACDSRRRLHERGGAVVSEGLGGLFSSCRFLKYRRAALELCRAIAYE